MGEIAIVPRLEAAGVADFATPRRIAWLRRLNQVYADEGVLGARSAPPLHERCPDASACWARFGDDAKPSSGEPWGFTRDRPGSIMWPWVGERYDDGGVAVLGLNFRSSDTEATVALEFLAAANDLDQFKTGQLKSRFGSDFPYRSHATAAALLASVDGQRPVEAPLPTDLDGVMERIARVQLVKCTPVDSVVDRGSPSPEMCTRCPPRFLQRELEVLRPGVLVAFGNDAHRALNPRPDVHWRNSGYFCRGRLRLGEHSCDLFWLPHPSHPDWLKGQRSLVRSLRRKPVTAAATSSSA